MGFNLANHPSLPRRPLDFLLDGYVEPTPSDDVLSQFPDEDVSRTPNFLFLRAIPDPVALARALSAIPGVVEHGLFLGMCHLAIIGKPDGTVVRLDRNADIDADMLAGEGD